MDDVIRTYQEVASNFTLLSEEWEKLKTTLLSNSILDKRTEEDRENAKIKLLQKTDMTLAELKMLISHLQHTLPAIVHSGATSATKVAALQQELNSTQKKFAELGAECLQWKNKFIASSADCQQVKQEACQLRQEVCQLSEQLQQQSEFSACLGAATTTLLWRVSKNSDTILALLSGSKVEELLGLIASTVYSYVEAYRDDWPQQETNESTFILALCGTIANIAASAYGRDFLMNSENGQGLIDAFLTFISKAPLKASAKIKSLMLIVLYNLSINKQGVQYLLHKPGTLDLLAWHLTEEKDADNRINTLRLLRSLAADSDASPTLLLEQNVLRPTLEALHQDPNRQIQEMAKELLLGLQPEH